MSVIKNVLIFKTTGVITKDQVKSSIVDFLRRANIKTQFDIRYDTDRDNKYRGASYVFIKSTEVYNLLLGKNRDGSARIERMRSVRHIENSEEIAAINEFRHKVVGFHFNICLWSELATICEEFDEAIVEKYGESMVETELEPLVELPYFQSAANKKSSFTIEREREWTKDKSRIPNVLFAQRVDPIVPISFFKVKFDMIAEEDYDLKEIHSRSGRAIQATFNPRTKDADKVLSLFRKRILVDSVTGKQALIIFNFCFVNQNSDVQIYRPSSATNQRKNVNRSGRRNRPFKPNTQNIRYHKPNQKNRLNNRYRKLNQNNRHYHKPNQNSNTNHQRGTANRYTHQRTNDTDDEYFHKKNTKPHYKYN